MNYKFSESIIKLLSLLNYGNLISYSVEDSCDILKISIGPLEIPQYPVYNVHRSEEITIFIYQNKLPSVVCRDDFPIVPHLNVYPDGKKELCLFDVSFEDIKYLFNASFFLQRIIYWFEQTAKGNLHQKDQPLDPYFPHVNEAVILNPSNSLLIRLKRIQSLNFTLYRPISISSINEGEVYTVITVQISNPYTKNIINKLPQTLDDLDSAFGEDHIVNCIDQTIPAIWKIRSDSISYKLAFNNSEYNLKQSPVLLLIAIPISRSPDLPSEYFDLKAFKLGKTFQELYITFGYKKDTHKRLIKSEQSSQYKTLKLHPLEVLFPFSKSLALNLNNQDISVSALKFVQIGLGALGSQIANNCIRSAFGNWCYIDPDILLPHNLSRHCLDEKYIGYNKAESMKSFADSFFNKSDSIIRNFIPANIFDKCYYDKIESEIQASDIVVDCSASIAVERYLTHELAGSTRAISFFLNPSGTSVIMLCENANRSITLDTLEMQYYRLITKQRELRDHLKSESLVLYSSNCRNSSMKYPQDNVSIFSGICSKSIKSVVTSSEAYVRVWTLDGFSINLHEEIGEFFEIQHAQNWTIKIASSTLKKIYQQRTQKLHNETGGVLIGSFDFYHLICYIVDSLDSPKDSKEYPFAYIRGHEGLLSKIRDIENLTVGNLTYVGEWHSHPSNSTFPSDDDNILLNYISQYMFKQGCPGCMLIAGDSQYSVYLKQYDA